MSFLRYILCFVALITMAAAEENSPVSESPQKQTAASQASPDFAKLVLAGFEKESSNDYKAAYEFYVKAAKLRGDSPTVLLRKAYCGAKIGLVDEVVNDLEAAIKLKPKTATDLYSMAWFRATVPYGRYRDGVLAVTLAQQALQKRESIEAYDTLAAGYAEMGDFFRATETLKAGIRKFSDSPRVPQMQERMRLYKDKKKFRETWSEKSLFKKQKIDYFR